MTQEARLNKQKHPILLFSMGEEKFGIDASCGREVLQPQPIHSFPQAPDFIDGVIQVRNHLVAVIDLRKKLGIKHATSCEKCPIIICKIDRFIMGLIVDKVLEVVMLPEETEISVPQIIAENSTGSCIYAMARFKDKVISLIGLDKLLSPQEIERLPNTT